MEEIGGFSSIIVGVIKVDYWVFVGFGFVVMVKVEVG